MSAGASEPAWEIEPAALKQLLDETDAQVLLLDCREPPERDAARIEGDVFIPLGELASRLDELTSRQREHVVVYCHHGGRSLRAAKLLRKAGLRQARSLAGGIDRWSQVSDPSVPRYY